MKASKTMALTDKPERVGNVWYPVADGALLIYRYQTAGRWTYRAHCPEHGWLGYARCWHPESTAERIARNHMIAAHNWDESE